MDKISSGKLAAGRLTFTPKGRRGPKPGTKKNQPSTPVVPTPLMSYLAAEAQSRGHTPVELAKQLGIGYVYLTQLLSGKKDTARLGREVLVAAANYLDVPVAEAYLWAGVLLPTDFVHEGKFKAMSGEQFDVMSRHPHWGGFMPTRDEWNSLSERSKLLIVMAFEQAAGVTLTDKTMVSKLTQ